LLPVPLAGGVVLGVGVGVLEAGGGVFVVEEGGVVVPPPVPAGSCELVGGGGCVWLIWLGASVEGEAGITGA
jgi:hypothetical protein